MLQLSKGVWGCGEKVELGLEVCGQWQYGRLRSMKKYEISVVQYVLA